MRQRLAQFIVFLLLAGNETSTNLIGNGTLALMRNPDQLALLRRDPGLLPRAIGKRCSAGPIGIYDWTLRKVILKLGGAELLAGTFAIMVLAAVNRDPSQFKNPEKSDITRDPI